MKLGVFTVTPSPYQRDFFGALHARLDTRSQVFYLEAATPDSPWPEEPLRPFESVLPGRTLGRGRVRAHNNDIPDDLTDFDALLLNIPLTSLTLHKILSRWPRHKPWYFWGEILNPDRGFLRRCLRRFQLSPLKKAQAILAVGEEARADYARRLPGVPAHSLPYSCDLNPFFALKRDNAEPVFLFCGQMILRKGIDILLQAMEAVPGARLRLAGREDHVSKWLEQMTHEARARVDLAGFLAPRDLPGFFASGTVFVLPSRHDGWAVVVPQALAAGLPVIGTTTTGASRELIAQGVNGWLVPPADPDALAETMRLAIRTNEAVMGDSARKSVAAYTPESMSHRLLDLIS